MNHSYQKTQNRSMMFTPGGQEQSRVRECDSNCNSNDKGRGLSTFFAHLQGFSNGIQAQKNNSLVSLEWQLMCSAYQEWLLLISDSEPIFISGS